MDPYREYQDYAVASRLLLALGLSREILPLAQYARLRLRRLALVREGRYAALEGLDERLRYGFWSNPLRLRDFLKRAGNAPYLASPGAFEVLLFSEERARLRYPGQAGEYYLGWLRLPALLQDPLAFEEVLREQEARLEALPLFLNAFHRVPGP
ncbi:hypothetical protein TCCBUS3UF1_18410 [Thermus sp. CCB_US3_UF1]|uniref:hypothetical protein n=1 Tax=Thermus sp. CCB_US3_UF1 TaxID=1111069 RepID=UPI00023894D0|nr:hypothetical protein [Thermus sp. CCB_US3_UF1]AEV16880.1 hypothetical protein TCCBUS3UF1_18410 [Thermus sp. CCB_US3_UF1]